MIVMEMDQTIFNILYYRSMGSLSSIYLDIDNDQQSNLLIGKEMMTNNRLRIRVILIVVKINVKQTLMRILPL